MKTICCATSFIATVFCRLNGAFAGQPETPPFFVGTPYDFTVDVSPPGLESFSFTGQARDVDPTQVVTISAILPPPRYQFSTTPGNPATFTIRIDNLTYADRNGTSFTLGADDDRGGGASTRFTLRIIPEPVGLMVAVVAGGMSIRRRRVVRH